jgi:formamidopyrimidine-DNA glycosylase
MSGSFGQLNKHSAIKFGFDNGDIYYNDIRHFGTIKVNQSPLALTDKLASLGWDPLENPTILEDLFDRIRKKANHKRIAEVMLDQSYFSGCGNWMRAEILYRAQINPFTLVQDLDDYDLTAIACYYNDVARQAYELKGATIQTYQTMDGKKGKFSENFQVYGRKQDPEGHRVLKVKDHNGRTIHYVAEIQT